MLLTSETCAIVFVRYRLNTKKKDRVRCETTEGETVRKLSNPNKGLPIKKSNYVIRLGRLQFSHFALHVFSQFMVCNYPSSYYNLVDLFWGFDFPSNPFTPIS